MSVLFWVSLAFALVVGIASIVLVAVRALELWRTFRSATRILAAGTERITNGIAAVEREASQISTDRLNTSVARLQGALAEARVLLREVRRAQRLVGSVTGLVPKK